MQPDDEPTVATSPRRLAELPGLEALRKNEHTRLLLLGGLVGVLGGLAAGLFDVASVAVGEILLGTGEPSATAPPFPWVVLGPAGAGLLAGLVIRYLSRGRRAQGIPDAIEGVLAREGSVSVQDGLASAAAAALAVGSGHSGGREGPIVQLASAFASRTCRWLGVEPRHARVLVASGAAAGIAASFNTPVGGAFFALEILLGNFALETFAPVVVATVAGTVVGEVLLGEDRIALQLPAFGLEGPLDLLLYPVLGVVCGLVAVGTKRLFFWTADRWEEIGVPPVFRPALAGLAVGVPAALGLNEVMGNGYGFLQELLAGETAPGLLAVLGLLVAKLVATAISKGAGSGLGIFAPSLFIGAMAGTAFGAAAALLVPDLAGPAGAYGTVGMGATVAALTQGPVTMTLMLFEMTGNYQVILPLLLAMAVASVVASAIDRRSYYLEALDRRGVRVDIGREALVMYDLRVEEVMRTEGFLVITPASPFEDLAEQFLTHRVDEIYVVDEDERFVGLVDIQDIKALLAEPKEGLTVRDLVRSPIPCTGPGAPLADVFPLFFRTGLEALPVVEDARLVGIVTERDIVGAYNQEVLRKGALLARVHAGPAGDRHAHYFELPIGHEMDVIEVDARLAGCTLRELRLPQRYGVTVLAVNVWDRPSGEHQRLPADADLRLAERDQIVVLGPVAAIAALAAGDPPPGA